MDPYFIQMSNFILQSAITLYHYICELIITDANVA